MMGRAISERSTVKHLLCMAVALVLALTSQAGADASADRPKGLMWNRTGLPAVFPLQVKTKPGRDYYLVLTDTATDEDALAAYIRGGRFFRVLVPPGSFRLTFHFGTSWQGEDDLFGAGSETGRFTLDKALTFETRGLRTKSGHLVDLTNMTFGQERSAQVRGLSFCQRPSLAAATDDLALAARQLDPRPEFGRYPFCPDLAAAGCNPLERRFRLRLHERVCS